METGTKMAAYAIVNAVEATAVRDTGTININISATDAAEIMSCTRLWYAMHTRGMP